MALNFHGLPRGSIVVPLCGSYSEPYKVIPKRNYLGAYGYRVKGIITQYEAP